MRLFLITSLILFSLALPLFSLAQISKAVPTQERGPLVTCGNNTDPITGELTSPCGFNDIVTLIWNVITFLIFYLAVPFAAVSVFYGGVLLLTFPEIPAKKDQAKKIIKTALIGILLALSAQLIVSAILNFFINPGTVNIQGAYMGVETVYAEEHDFSDTPSGFFSPGVSVPSEEINGPSSFQILRYNSIRGFVIGILDLIVQIGWPLMVFAVIYVGFLFVAARGNPGKISEAVNAAKFTAIGIAVILGSYLLIQVLDATIKDLTNKPRSGVIINFKNS